MLLVLQVVICSFVAALESVIIVVLETVLASAWEALGKKACFVKAHFIKRHLSLINYIIVKDDSGLEVVLGIKRAAKIACRESAYSHSIGWAIGKPFEYHY